MIIDRKKNDQQNMKTKMTLSLKKSRVLGYISFALKRQFLDSTGTALGHCYSIFPITYFKFQGMFFALCLV